MPILANAKKALRRDRRRTVSNRQVKDKMKAAIKTLRESSDAKLIPTAFQTIDRAVKKNLIHKNKAAHLKSQISKLAGATPAPKAASKAKSTSKSKSTKKATLKTTKKTIKQKQA